MIFVALSVEDNSKEKMVKRVCNVLKQIDYVGGYRRVVIDSLIAFQIENFVKSKQNRENLNEVVDMQMSVEELFIQVKREYEFDSGYNKGMAEGKKEVKDEIILNMLKESVDDETILKTTKCSRKHLNELKAKII